jgi:hypothetical protein
LPYVIAAFQENFASLTAQAENAAMRRPNDNLSASLVDASGRGSSRHDPFRTGIEGLETYRLQALGNRFEAKHQLSPLRGFGNNASD